MSDKQPKKYKNSFHLRIYDFELLKSLTELFETGKFDSMNILLNRALAIGAEKIYLEFGKRKALSSAQELPDLPDAKKLDRISAQLERLRIMNEDTMILMNSIEGLTASIYAVQRAEVSGEPMSAELMDSGYLAKLPQAYQDTKDRLVERFNRKLEKENDKK